MAIESLELALDRFGTPLYVYHEIVHNQYVVNRFRNAGVTFVETLDEVPNGQRVMYSAHGVSPESRRISAERNLQTIDATCPLVTKVHKEAIRYAKEGYTIILVGHEGHDEVIGTLNVEPGISLETIEKLRAMGHRVEVVDNGIMFGGYQAILRDPETGVYTGATEMRKDGLAIGY